MSDHTPEPWTADIPFIYAGNDERTIVEVLGERMNDETWANTRRIVACVNALKDVSTEELEAFVAHGGALHFDENLGLLRQQVADLRAVSDALSDALMRDWNRSTKESSQRVVDTWKRLTEVLAATQPQEDE